MTRFVLDTTSLIDFTKDLEPQRSRIWALLGAGNELVLCSVTVAELYAGFSADQIEQWETVSRYFRYRHVSLDAAKAAGRDRYRFARQGLTIATTDALVAAIARELGAILVTDNLRHFPMADIQTLSLRG